MNVGVASCFWEYSTWHTGAGPSQAVGSATPPTTVFEGTVTGCTQGPVRPAVVRSAHVCSCALTLASAIKDSPRNAKHRVMRARPRLAGSRRTCSGNPHGERTARSFRHACREGESILRAALGTLQRGTFIWLLLTCHPPRASLAALDTGSYRLRSSPDSGWAMVRRATARSSYEPSSPRGRRRRRCRRARRPPCAVLLGRAPGAHTRAELLTHLVVSFSRARNAGMPAALSACAVGPQADAPLSCSFSCPWPAPWLAASWPAAARRLRRPPRRRSARLPARRWRAARALR